MLSILGPNCAVLKGLCVQPSAAAVPFNTTKAGFDSVSIAQQIIRRMDEAIDSNTQVGIGRVAQMPDLVTHLRTGWHSDRLVLALAGHQTVAMYMAVNKFGELQQKTIGLS